MSETTIRPATPGDVSFFVSLVYFASPEYPIIFGSRSDATMSSLFKRRRNLFSHEFAQVALVDGRPAGFMLAYDYKQKKTLAASTAAMIAMTAGFTLLKSVPFLVKNADVLERIEPGEYFLSNIVVCDGFRGHGVGAVLMKKLEKDALARGCDKVVLETNAENARAISFYAGLGYSVVDTFSFVLSGGKRTYRRMAKNV
ncbi:MAG TPA: GNAT family N-acetyltransferase [bacterium]|nr:GNAT family N-acetyltransferase [bacterium]